MVLPMSCKRKREDRERSLEREAHPHSRFLITSTNNETRYKCKTCNKEFSTFQALGGHRASHKNPIATNPDQALGPLPTKFHECDVCGEKFVLGQALGGHMTKHRNEIKEKAKNQDNIILPSEEDSVLESRIGSIIWEDFVGDGVRGRGSELVTIDFFAMEPVRGNVEPVEIEQVVDHRDDSWLDLKLGLADLIQSCIH